MQTKSIPLDPNYIIDVSINRAKEAINCFLKSADFNGFFCMFTFNHKYSFERTKILFNLRNSLGLYLRVS